MDEAFTLAILPSKDRWRYIKYQMYWLLGVFAVFAIIFIVAMIIQKSKSKTPPPPPPPPPQKHFDLGGMPPPPPSSKGWPIEGYGTLYSTTTNPPPVYPTHLSIQDYMYPPYSRNVYECTRGCNSSVASRGMFDTQASRCINSCENDARLCL